MSTDTDLNLLRTGVAEPAPEAVSLQAGPLRLLYEGGDLRRIFVGDVEIVQRIYVAVRDGSWTTIPLRLQNEVIERQADAFRITYDAVHEQGAVDFRWRATLAGAADGSLSFALDGTAHSSFARNRIGICVLHPATSAGAALRVEHTDGAVEQGTFPRLIAPHQPFFDIRAITHQAAPDVWAEVRFAGDVWEMEDQRNWTDASFKTYSTPLALPAPVTVEAGTHITQTVTLRLHAAPDTVPEAPDDTAPVRITAGGVLPERRMPSLGLVVAGHEAPLTPTATARLGALNLAHLRFDLRLGQADYDEALRQAIAEARALDAALEIALYIDDASQITALAALLRASAPPVARWLIFGTAEPVPDSAMLAAARQQLAPLTPHAQIGSGTDSHFTALNRNRPQLESLDLLAFAVTPQVHAADSRSLMENLATQATVIASARQLAGGRPIAVGPVTLRPRGKPGAAHDAAATSAALPAEVDPRQAALFGAAWTLGSLSALAYGGAASLTYYETTGWLGVLVAEAGAPRSQLFPSAPNTVFPLYHVLADVGALRSAELVEVTNSAPQRCAVLALEQDGRRRVLVANLTPTAQRVQLSVGRGAAEIKLLDETSMEAAVRTPEAWRAEPGVQAAPEAPMLELTLLPYAVARVDIGSMA